MRRPESEKAFAARVRKEIEAMPRTWCFKPFTGSVRGIPDLICCVSGWFVSLEFKKAGAAKDSSRERLQEYVASKIRFAGAPIAEHRVTPASWPAIRERLVQMAGETFS